MFMLFKRRIGGYYLCVVAMSKVVLIRACIYVYAF